MIKLLVCGIAGFSADALILERFTAAFKDEILGRREGTVGRMCQV
jgi:hypothetical protein